MFSITPQHSKILGALAPSILIISVLWLYPTADLGDPRFSAYFRLSAAAVILFCAVLWGINKWVAMFLLLAGVSSIIPFSTRFSTEAFRAVFIGCLWFYLITIIPKDKISYLLDAICILALFNITMLVFQYFGFDPIFKPRGGGDGTPVVGFLSNKNEASAFLAFCFPAFLRNRWKYFTPLIFLGLLISSSTGGFLAAILATLAYWILRDGKTVIKNNWPYIIALFVLMSVFFGFIDIPNISSNNSRFTAWSKGAELYKQHWLFGSGIGHWKIVFMQTKISGLWFVHAHNEFIQGVFEMGIGFAILVCGYLLNIFKYRERAILPATALVAIVSNSMVNFPFHIAQTAIIAITWMAMFEVMLTE